MIKPSFDTTKTHLGHRQFSQFALHQRAVFSKADLGKRSIADRRDRRDDQAAEALRPATNLENLIDYPLAESTLQDCGDGPCLAVLWATLCLSHNSDESDITRFFTCRLSTNVDTDDVT